MIHGVNKLKRCLCELPVGINQRFMTLRLRLTKNQQATIVSAYEPTMDANEDEKEDFYSQLETILSETLKKDRIILLGDFSACVGRDSDLWKGTIRKEGVGQNNSNGILLLTKCAEHELIITNTLF